MAADVLAAGGERLLAVNGEVVTGHEAGTEIPQVGVKSAVGEARAKQVESAERQGDAAYSVQDHKWVPPSRYLQCSCLLFQIEGRHWHKLEEDRVRKQKASRETNRRETKSAAPGLPAWSPTAVLPRLEPA